MGDHVDVPGAIDALTTRRPYTKSRAAVARPTNPRPLSEVLDAEFEPALPPPALPRPTLAAERVRRKRELAAQCRTWAIRARAVASDPRTPDDERAAALADAAQQDESAQSFDRSAEMGGF